MNATEDIGIFWLGERPDLIAVTFKDGTPQHNPINITGCTAKWVVQREDDTPTTVTATITNASGGEATTPSGPDCTVAGNYRGQMWAGDGVSIRRASSIFIWRVLAPVGSAPNI